MCCGAEDNVCILKKKPAEIYLEKLRQIWKVNADLHLFLVAPGLPIAIRSRTN